MGNNKYEVVDVFWKRSGFNLQIVRVHESELDDKLAVISSDEGISRIEYYNFLLSKFLIDVDRVGRYVGSVTTTEEEEMELVNEVVNHVVEINPLINPELLVISDSGVIKIPSDKEMSVRRLVDNPRWNMGPEELMSDSLLSDDEFGGRFYGSEVKVISKDWDEAGIVLKVYKFDEKDVEKLFKDQRKFYGPANYKTFISQKCIHDLMTVMIILDTSGITNDIPPKELADALYNFCIEENPFLKMENAIAKKLIEVGKGPIKKGSSAKTKPTRRSGKPSAKQATAGSTAAQKSEPEKGFTSISKEELLSLSDRIKKSVVGQDEAIEVITDAIQIAGCGLRDPGKPVGAFLFCGETGVGKSLTAKVLSKELCGEESEVVRIDCSEYGHSHEISKLIGSPPGYLGHDAGGQLTNKIIEKPFSVVLFDEIEKAHSKMYDILLQVLDEGRLTDGKGTTVDFADCVIILTSNLGVRDVKKIGKTLGFGDVSTITESRKQSAISKSLNKHFKPEFLNRLDAVITFKSLEKEQCLKIIDLEFDKIVGYLKNRDLSLEATPALKEFVFNKGFNRAYGARELTRVIEKEVVKPLAKKILLGEVKEKSTILADYINDSIKFSSKNARAKVIDSSSIEDLFK